VRQIDSRQLSLVAACAGAVQAIVKTARTMGFVILLIGFAA
jgi:hypothetical protein